MKTLDEVIVALEVCTSSYCSHPKYGDCPYIDDKYDCDTRQRKLDALHYLKEYKIKRDRIMAQAQACDDSEKRLQDEITRYQEAVKNCEVAENKYKRLYEELRKTSQLLRNDPDGDHQQLLKCQALLQDFYRNDPLDWETLTQMEGKPVWVEWTKTEESYWCFVGEWFYDDEMRIYRMGLEYADYIHKTIYTPDIVQAYRKERN